VAQLEREHTELEKVERVRKDFVINVSHELRTPLASIQGYTETLMDGALYDADHNIAVSGDIRHNAERLARLTEDLLTLSRIEQKRQKFEFEKPSGGRIAEGRHGPGSPHRGEERHPAGGGFPARRHPGRGATARLYRRFSATCWTTPSSSRPPEAGSRWGRARPAGISSCTSATRESGFPPKICRASSNASTAWIRPARESGRQPGLGLSIVKHLVAALDGTTRVESAVGQVPPSFHAPGERSGGWERTP